MPRKDKAEEYLYVLDWIQEATDARRAQNAFVERTIKAYQGEPAKNRYKGSVKAYIDSVAKTDATLAKSLTDLYNDIPDKKNFTVHDAVEAVVSMSMGGVGRYEFGPYDPDLEHDDKTVDMLASAAKHFYNTEKIDSVVPQYIRNAVLSGASYLHVKQKNKKKVFTMLDSDQMLTDPKRMKTNVTRFIGFHQRESFEAIRSRTMKTQGGYVLKTLNEAKVYVSKIVQELNSVLNNNKTAADFLHEQLRRDLDIFYKPILARYTEYKKSDPEAMYSGDEVEISYIYDMMNDMYFEVVNRKYIIVAKKNDLKRTVKCKFIGLDGKTKTVDKTIALDNPIIELPYLKTFWDTYPISPLFYILDDFDDLCAMESVLFHNLSVQAPLTFIGQASDAVKMQRASQIAGEIVEGLPQTFAVLEKSHDNEPVITAMQRYEERIKKIIAATDPFQMQAMLGDRASAKEVSALSGQISQGLNPFVANIETAMATLGEKVMKLHLIMNNEPYQFVHNGKYAELSPEDMAGDYEVTAKLTSSIKMEQEANARKALELVQYMGSMEEINKEQFFGVMLPIVLSNLVTREQASNMVIPKYQPLPEETIAGIRKREQDNAKRDEIDKMDFSQYEPEQLDEMIKQIGGVASDPSMFFDGGTSNGPQDPNNFVQQFDAQGNVVPHDGGAPAPEENPAIVNPQQMVDPNAQGTISIGGNGPAQADVAGEVFNDPARTAI